MVRRAGQGRGGFTLVEVLVSLVLLAVGLLGLAAVSGFAATSLHHSFAQERAARRAAGILDSLCFSAAGDGTQVIDGIRYRWRAAAGAASEVRVTASVGESERIIVDLHSRRILVPAAPELP